MSQKKRVFSLLACLMSVLVLPCCLYSAESDNALAGSQSLVIRFSHTVANETAKGQMALKFKEILEKSSQNRIRVEVSPNGEMFNDDQIAESLLLDYVQMAAPSASKLTEYIKQLKLFDLPFIFKDMKAVDAFEQSDAGQGILDSFTQRGLYGLGYLHNGMKQLSANKALKVPADAKGLKFRIMNSDILEAQFHAVGATTRDAPFSQVYSLIAGGALDGQENTWSNILTKDLYKVQPYITESNHGVLDYVVITSVAFWDNLQDDEKTLVREALKEAIAYGNSIASQKDEEAKQKIVQSKQAELISLSKDQRDQWIAAMRPVWKKYETEIGKELIEKAVNSN